jgi:UDP-3-O-[3-hydroxymyristoyl] glucosamine N-acyltransferase
MITLDQISKWCGAQVANPESDTVPALSPSFRLKGVATLADAGPDQAAFFFSKNYEADLRTTRAGVIITGTAFVGALKAAGLSQWSTAVFLACDDPYSGMASVTREIAKTQCPHEHLVPNENGEVHPTAVIDPTARIGANVMIGPHVVIEKDAILGDRVTLYAGAWIGPSVTIGDDTVVFPKVSLYHATTVGKRCRIHAGAVIGSDGFGYAQKKDPATGLPVDHQKIHHLGRVIIGDDVEIGSNSTIDRGTLGNTVVHDKVKIDNLVQIGHNVVLEEGAVLCGCSGVAGSSTMGKFAVLGAQAGLANQVHLGAYSVMAAYAAAIKDFPPHSVLAGIPARPQAELYRIMALQSKMMKERGRKK